jgi:hypothetical protein
MRKTTRQSTVEMDAGGSAASGPDVIDSRQILQRYPTINVSAFAVSTAMAADPEIPHDVRGIGLFLAHLMWQSRGTEMGIRPSDLRVPGTSRERVLTALQMLRDRGHLDADNNFTMRGIV